MVVMEVVVAMAVVDAVVVTVVVAATAPSEVRFFGKRGKDAVEEASHGPFMVMCALMYSSIFSSV